MIALGTFELQKSGAILRQAEQCPPVAPRCEADPRRTVGRCNSATTAHAQRGGQRASGFAWSGRRPLRGAPAPGALAPQDLGAELGELLPGRGLEHEYPD